MSGRIIIVTGPPGAGKSTLARKLATESDRERAVHLHTDDFYVYIRKGYRDPWLPEAHPQNIVVADALTSTAAAFAAGGYDVLADGVIGPWLIEPWLKIARERSLDVRYIVLRPDEASTIARATARTAPNAMKDEAVVRQMWNAFAALGAYDAHVLDTTAQTVETTTEAIRSALREGRYRLA
jgi:predicted kinase